MEWLGLEIDANALLIGPQLTQPSRTRSSTREKHETDLFVGGRSELDAVSAQHAAHHSGQ